MGGFASLIGGSASMPIESTNPNNAMHYFWTSGSGFVDMGGQDDRWTTGSGAGSVTVAGGDGNDWIQSTGRNADNLCGQAGNDTIFAAWDRNAPGGSNSTVDGGAGNDLLVGTSGDNRLDGGTGNDIIAAGAGADRVVPHPAFWTRGCTTRRA